MKMMEPIYNVKKISEMDDQAQLRNWCRMIQHAFQLWGRPHTDKKAEICHNSQASGGCNSRDYDLITGPKRAYRLLKNGVLIKSGKTSEKDLAANLYKAVEGAQ